MDLSQLPIWVLAPAIFFARIMDVSLGTLRTIVVFRGYRFTAAALGFVEILIWLAAASQVFQNLDTWYLGVCYAAGFAAGNIVGIWLESKLAMGSELVRVLSLDPDVNLARRLQRLGYSVIDLAGTGDDGKPVEVLLIEERRKQVPRLLNLIREIDPHAFWTITDVKRRIGEPGLRHRGVWTRPEWLRVIKRK